MVDPQTFLDNSNKHINRDGDPDLCLHSILGGSIKRFDPKMHLDPFEKQLDLPATTKEFCNRNDLYLVRSKIPASSRKLGGRPVLE